MGNTASKKFLHTGQAQDRNGTPLTDYQVTVIEQDNIGVYGNSIANLYSDANGINSLPNPLVINEGIDFLGNYSFYAETGYYTLKFSGGVIQGEYDQKDVVVGRPAGPGALWGQGTNPGTHVTPFWGKDSSVIFAGGANSNVTANLLNFVGNSLYTFIISSNSNVSNIGGNTIATPNFIDFNWPSNVIGGGNISVAAQTGNANIYLSQQFLYNKDTNTFYAVGPLTSFPHIIGGV